MAALFWFATGVLSLLGLSVEWIKGSHSLQAELTPYVLLAIFIVVPIRCRRVNLCRPKGPWGYVWACLGPICSLSYFINNFWAFACIGWGLTIWSMLLHTRVRGEAKPIHRNPLKRLLISSPQSTLPLLVLLAPIPGSTLLYWKESSQVLSREFASYVLDLCSINHQYAANQLVLINKDVELSTAYGIFGLLSCVFLAALIQSLRDRPIWLLPLYLGSGWAAAVVSCATSMLCLVFLYQVDGLLNVSYAYWICQAVALMLAMFFLFSMDRFILVTFFPTRVDEFEVQSNPLVTTWNSIWHRGELNATKSQLDG